VDDQSLQLSEKEKLMKPRTLYFLLGLAVVTMAFRTEVKTDSYIGYAYAEGSDQLIYTEEFTDTFVDGNLTETLTRYFDPRHRQIAERKLRFGSVRFVPDFTTEDLRSGYQEGAEAKGNTITLFRKENRNAKREEKTFTTPHPFVIDAGFNPFIKTNWKRLEKGENVVFNFGVPAKLDYYSLRATRIHTSDTEMTVKIEPDKALLRWLSSPIIIVYNKQTRRIISYQGKSNIADGNGNNFMTKLIYPDKGP
jgi:hypothetical protein